MVGANTDREAYDSVSEHRTSKNIAIPRIFTPESDQPVSPNKPSDSNVVHSDIRARVSLDYVFVSRHHVARAFLFANRLFYPVLIYLIINDLCFSHLGKIRGGTVTRFSLCDLNDLSSSIMQRPHSKRSHASLPL